MEEQDCRAVWEGRTPEEVLHSFVTNNCWHRNQKST